MPKKKDISPSPVPSFFKTSIDPAALHVSNSTANKRGPSRLEDILAHKKSKVDLISGTESNTQLQSNLEDRPFPEHPLEDEDLWISTGLLVRVKKDGWEYDGQKGLVGAPDGLAWRVNLKKEVELRLGPSVMDTIVPSVGRWVRVCLGAYRGHEGRLVAADVPTEAVDVALFVGPAWGDKPQDLQTILDPYSRQLRRKAKESILLRGELILEKLPFDAVCRCIPPEGYEDMDVQISDEPELDPFLE